MECPRFKLLAVCISDIQYCGYLEPEPALLNNYYVGVAINGQLHDVLVILSLQWDHLLGVRLHQASCAVQKSANGRQPGDGAVEQRGDPQIGQQEHASPNDDLNVVSVNLKELSGSVPLVQVRGGAVVGPCYQRKSCRRFPVPCRPRPRGRLLAESCAQAPGSEVVQ